MSAKLFNFAEADRQIRDHLSSDPHYQRVRKEFARELWRLKRVNARIADGPRKVDYVCGFLFTPELDKVALIRKLRPAWQKGKWNGIGGHIELGESPLWAMRREFFEETGGHVVRWRYFAQLECKGARVHFFKSFEPTTGIRTKTDETVSWVHLMNLPQIEVIPNLRWLIPAALSGAEIAFSEPDPSENK